MKEDLEEIRPEYVYMTIPAEYVCMYHKLVTLMSEVGKDIIDDCTYACQNKGKTIVNCWAIFQSAIAAYNLGEYKKANFQIKFIEEQFKYIYKNDTRTYPTSIPVSITPDGKLKAVVSCCSKQRFYVDTETGKLYREHLDKPECNAGTYDIHNHNLTFTRHE